jgi:Na+/H+ antiporter NhaD/arsenite permease-like protein
VLILSAGPGRTGVAGLIGRQVLRLAGRSEARLIALIMVLVGVLSGFMNDIGVAGNIRSGCLDTGGAMQLFKICR